MKNIKLLFIILILIMSLNQKAAAQEKIAHINVSELMDAMPDMKTANAALKKLREKHDQEYNKMVEDYKARMKNTPLKLQQQLTPLIKPEILN